MQSLLPLIPTDAVSAMFPAIADAAVKGLLLLCAVVIAAQFLKRNSAAVRHLVWTVAMLSLLLLPIPGSLLPSWRVLPAWSELSFNDTTQVRESLLAVDEPQVAMQVPVQMPEQFQSDASNESHQPNPVAGDQTEKRRQDAADTGINVRALVTSAWCFGTILLLFRFGFGHVRLCLMRGTKPVNDDRVQATFESLVTEVGITRRVRLAQSSCRNVPMTWGLFRPVLLLPDDAVNWTDSKLRSVILHELSHIRRFDYGFQLLTQFVCAMYWFNPLVWFAARRQRIEREHATDDAVLRRGVSASEYAEDLLQVASGLPSRNFAALVAVGMARNIALEHRIGAILDMKRNRREVSFRAVTAVLVVGALLVVPLAVITNQVDAQPPAKRNTQKQVTANAPKPSDMPRFAVYRVEDAVDDLDDMELSKEPVLTEFDFVSYDWKTHTMELTNAGIKKLPAAKDVGVRGMPFVVVADAQRCYLGAFWVGASSFSHPRPVMLIPFAPETRTVKIQRAYPHPSFAKGNDPRSDARILKALTGVRKLKANQEAQEPAKVQTTKDPSTQTDSDTEWQVISDPERLALSLIPGLKLRHDDKGKLLSVTIPDGRSPDLKTFRHSPPSKSGYWQSPAMKVVAKASPNIDSKSAAEKVIAALHTITSGSSMVHQKKYRAHSVDRAWIVRTGHDFDRFPAMVQYIHPYEIEVDANDRIVQIQQRYHHYLGSPRIYRDTISRTRKLQDSVPNGRRHYHDVLKEEFVIATAKFENRELTHNSRRYYPNAVTLVKDAKTDDSYYVESSGRNVFVRNAEGATVQIIEITRVVDLKTLVGTAVIRHLVLRDKQLIATVGKHTEVVVDRSTGKVVSVSSD